MAQIKTLKFNDNVFKVNSDGGVTIVDVILSPNGGGELIIANNSQSAGMGDCALWLKDGCGSARIRIGENGSGYVQSDFPSITFYNGDAPGGSYSVGVHCGNFEIVDGNGIAIFSIPSGGSIYSSNGVLYTSGF